MDFKMYIMYLILNVNHYIKIKMNIKFLLMEMVDFYLYLVEFMIKTNKYFLKLNIFIV